MKFLGTVVFLVATFCFFANMSASSIPGDKDKDKKKEPAGCDTDKVVRTSNDSLILKKYEKVYQRMGGICYILHLQELAKMKKVSDSTYNVKVKQSNTTQSRVDWSTYLFCPIGKPNGTVTLIAENGDSIQQCTYKDEKKNGLMIWWKAKNEVMHVVQFTNDVQKIRAIDTMMSYNNR